MKPADLPLIDRLRWAVDQPVTRGKTAIITAASHEHFPGVVARFRAAVVRSRGVVFDKAASAKLGKISAAGPEVLLYLAQSARLPWDSVIVQIDRPSFWRAANERHVNVDGIDPGQFISPDIGGEEETRPPGESDQLLLFMEQVDGNPARIRFVVIGPPRPDTGIPEREEGFLIEPVGFEIDTSGESLPSRETALGRLFRTSCNSHLRKQAEALWKQTHQNGTRLPPWTTEEFQTNILAGRDPLDLLALGREFVPAMDRSEHGIVTIGDWDPRDVEARQRLASLMAPVASAYVRLADLKTEDRQQVADLISVETHGTPRLALCILIALGVSGGSVLTDERPRGHRMVGNRRCPYLATSRIVIDLAHPLHFVRNRLEGDSGQHKRAHEVRGFWRYYQKFGRGGRPDCAHVWEPVVPEKPDHPIDKNRQACVHCGARRTWIPQHQRGDASLGYVTHEAVEVIDSTVKGSRAGGASPLTPPLTAATYVHSEQEENR